MADSDRPQIYLITPPAFARDTFPDRLAAVLDAAEVACIRLALASRDEDDHARAADALREVAHAPRHRPGDRDSICCWSSATVLTAST